MMTVMNGRRGAKTLEEELSLPILLAERVRKAIGETESFKSECSELGKQVDLLADMLRAIMRRLTSKPTPYERPVSRITSEASKALERALAAVRRCRRTGVLCRIVTIATASADLRKAQSLVESSVGDFRWLLSVYSPDEAARGEGVGLVVSLPPIARNEPILSYVWSCVASVQMGANPSARAEAANAVTNLALDNDRNKKIIIEEGGVPPLLFLLKEGASLEAQAAATSALAALAADREHVSLILAELAVPVIVAVLSDGPMELQTHVAALVASMASHDPDAQEEFGRDKAIRTLVTLLSLEVPLDELRTAPKKLTSIHSLGHINRDVRKALSRPASSSFCFDSGGRSRGGSGASLEHHYHQRKEMDNESTEVKLRLKVACAEALWMLSRGCISNSRKITETKGLLCLSKLIELEKGKLQLNCMMTVMEIAAVAESDAELRRSAFKTNSPAAKLVVDQLLRIVQEGSNPSLKIPAMKAIGSLARTFPARETRVLNPLVAQLGHWNPNVTAEAARVLGKFASPENFLCVEHSKVIVEFGGVLPLIRMLRGGEKMQFPALMLLCCLALNVADNEALERAKALETLESVARTAVAQDAPPRELLPRAISQLQLYRTGANTQRHSSADGASNFHGAMVY